MKTSLIAFALILSTSLFAQDSSRITQTITLSRLHHTYLIGFMGNIQTADKIKYVNQVKSGYDTTNMSQTVAVTASSALILEIFYVMSQQPEGWTSEYNNQIKEALLPQITNPWLGAKLAKVVESNDAVRDAKIAEAKQLIISINQ